MDEIIKDEMELPVLDEMMSDISPHDEEFEKNQMAAQALDVTNRAHAIHVQQQQAIGAVQFFQEHPELVEDQDLIGAEVMKISPDFSADQIADTKRRLAEAAERVLERKQRLNSPDKNVPGPGQLLRMERPSAPASKAEDELNQAWIGSLRERQKEVRRRF